MHPYTKTGDEGFTLRPGERRVRKSDPLVEANGALDELNAVIGLCLRQARADGDGNVRDALVSLQAELLTAGAILAAIGADPPPVALPEDAVRRMEGRIDQAWAKLPKLTVFLLPGGSELACRLHLARTVCRRAERAVVAAADADADVPALLLRYLNRMSDLLFALARLANFAAGVEEERWAR